MAITAMPWTTVIIHNSLCEVGNSDFNARCRWGKENKSSKGMAITY